MDEHRVIEKVLDALETALRGERIDRTFFAQAIDFFRSFADGCHHAKEEDELFPVLEASGVPRDGGPIGCMLFEHDQGRSLLRRIDEHLEAAAQGQADAVRTVRTAAQEYIVLLRRHIQKEDTVLFVLADEILHADQQQAMATAFQEKESAHGAPDKHDSYVRLADDLSRRAHVVGSGAQPA